jgi:hypothetical protein
VATQNRQFDGGQTARFDDGKLAAVCLAASSTVTSLPLTTMSTDSRVLTALREHPPVLKNEEF